MSYYPKEENQEPAPGTGSKKPTGYELHKLREEAKLKADAKAFHSREHANMDLVEYLREVYNK